MQASDSSYAVLNEFKEMERKAPKPAKYTLTISKINLIRSHVAHETTYAKYLNSLFCKLTHFSADETGK